MAGFDSLCRVVFILLSSKSYSFAIFGVLIGFLGQSERFLQVLDISSIESRADCWCLDVRSAVAGSRVGLTGGRSGRLSFRDISRRVCIASCAGDCYAE